MRRLRLLLIAPAILAGLLLVAAAALYGVSRLSWFERQTSARLSAALGWPVEVGELAIGYFPSPSLAIERLTVAAPDAGAPMLVEVATARLVLPWRTVLGLDSDLRSVELRAPQLRLATDTAGRGNWEGFVERLAALGGDEPAGWSIGSLAVTDGGLELHRDADGGTQMLTGLVLQAEDVRPGRPFPLDLRLAGQAGGLSFHLKTSARAMLDPGRSLYAADEMVLDGWLGGDDLPLAGLDWAATARSLRWDGASHVAIGRGLQFTGPGIRAAVEAEMTDTDTTPAASFEVTTEPFSPRTLGRALNRPLPETADPAALSRAVLMLRGHWNAAGLTLETLEGKLDDSHFSGSLALPAGGTTPQIRLEVDSIDLDRYLPPTPAGQADASPQSVLQALLAGLQALDVDAEIQVGEARAAGVVAQDMRVKLKPVVVPQP